MVFGKRLIKWKINRWQFIVAPEQFYFLNIPGECGLLNKSGKSMRVTINHQTSVHTKHAIRFCLEAISGRKEKQLRHVFDFHTLTFQLDFFLNLIIGLIFQFFPLISKISLNSILWLNFLFIYVSRGNPIEESGRCIWKGAKK